MNELLQVYVKILTFIDRYNICSPVQILQDIRSIALQKSAFSSSFECLPQHSFKYSKI